MSSDLEGDPITGEVADIMNKYLVSKLRSKGYRRYRGCILPVRYSEMAEKIENLNVRDDDIWVMSYPKAGTTWTQEMVWCIENNLDYEGAKELLSQRFPFLDYSSLFDYSEIIANTDYRPPSHILDAVTYIENLKPKRFIKTHLPWSLLPKQIRDGTKKPKIIYVCRNAKDTCISYYYHCVLLAGYTGNFQDFCKLFMENGVHYSPFWDNIRGFWERRNQDNILFLKYEDMSKNLDAVVRQTAVFLEKDLTDEQVDRLCDHLSFKNMKNNPAVNFEQILKAHRQLKIAPEEGEFMRRGTGGEWKDKMTPEMIEQFDSWINKNIDENKMDIWDD